MRNGIRKIAVALGVTIGMFAIAGPGAQAATAGNPLQASADAQALRIDLTVPTIDALAARLSDAGILPAGTITSVKGVTDVTTNLSIVLSLAHGDVSAPSGSVVSGSRSASGFAEVLSATLNGTPLKLDQKINLASAKSSCAVAAHEAFDKSKNCTGTDVSGGNLPVKFPARVDLPSDLGYVEISPVSSVTDSVTQTSNEVGLVNVHLDVRPLFGKDGALKPIGDALNQLTAAINDNVVPAVNGVIDTIKPKVNGVVPDVTINDITKLPMITDGSLLDLTVLPAKANVAPIKAGSPLLDATSMSKIIGLKVLNTDNALSAPWVSIGALTAKADAHALGADVSTGDPTKIRLANATQSFSVQDMNIGGLVHVDNSALDAVKGGVTTIVSNLGTKLGNPSGYDNVIKVANLLDSIAGVSLAPIQGSVAVPPTQLTKTTSKVRATIGGKRGVKTTERSDLAFSARAVSDSLALLVQPALPNLNSIKAKLAAGGVPSLDKKDFVPTGIALQVSMPNAQAFITQGAQVEALRFARTGVAGPAWLAASLFFTAALIVRRFVIKGSK